MMFIVVRRKKGDIINTTHNIPFATLYNQAEHNTTSLLFQIISRNMNELYKLNNFFRKNCLCQNNISQFIFMC